MTHRHPIDHSPLLLWQICTSHTAEASIRTAAIGGLLWPQLTHQYAYKHHSAISSMRQSPMRPWEPRASTPPATESYSTKLPIEMARRSHLLMPSPMSSVSIGLSRPFSPAVAAIADTTVTELTSSSAPHGARCAIRWLWGQLLVMMT